MKDIEKLKEKQEKEMRLALLENKLELEHPELATYNLHVNVIETLKDRYVCGFRHEDICKKLNEKEVAMILATFLPDEHMRVFRGNKRGYEMVDYDMKTYRRPSDTHTTLEIRWMYQGLECSVGYPIENDSELKSWFKIYTRELDDSEISSYGIQKTKYNYEFRKNFRFLGFAQGNVIRYSGGHVQQTCDTIIYEMIEQLKYMYNFNEE